MESLKKNDLFYTCSLIEYIARKTKNRKKVIVESLGIIGIQKILDLASVYHSENIDEVSDTLIRDFNIPMGDYEILRTNENIPSYFEIGRVYARLIVMVNPNVDSYVSTLMEVLTSWIVEKIDMYQSSMYYENPSYIYECYQAGRILD